MKLEVSLNCNLLWSQFKMATINRLRVCYDVLKRLLMLPRWTSSSLAFTKNGVINLGVIRRHSIFSMKSRWSVLRAPSSPLSGKAQPMYVVLYDRRGWNYCVCSLRDTYFDYFWLFCPIMTKLRSASDHIRCFILICSILDNFW